MTSSTPPDHGQYALDSIRAYEAVYGRDFVSPGGYTTTLALLELVAPTPGSYVLDIGCGLGGAAFLLARRFGARVHGVDLSPEMLALARERCREVGLDHIVTFEQADVLDHDVPGAYDLVHSRDAFLHIEQKQRLFATIARSLRPGGRLLFSDYLRADAPPSQEFAAYVQARNYSLCTLEEYRAHIRDAGLAIERAEDRTDEFSIILERELARIAELDLSPQQRDELTHGWQSKLRRARAGEQRWGVFVGKREP